MEPRTHRVVPKRELSYAMLKSIGAEAIGTEYCGGRKSTFGSAYDVTGVRFTRYFNAAGAEVAYRCAPGLDTVCVFGTPRIWGVQKPQLRPLTETNWDC